MRVVSNEVTVLANYVAELVDDMGLYDDILSTKENGTSEGDSSWKIKDKAVINKIWNTVDMIDLTYLVKEKTIRETLKYHDGYLIPLTEGRWFKVLLQQETITGLVLYQGEYAYRVYAENRESELSCHEYKIKNIRGTEFYTVQEKGQ